MSALLQISVALSPSAPVLLVSPDPADSCYLREILGNLDSELVSAGDLRSAKRFLGDGSFRVVITERDLPDGDWLSVLCTVEGLEHPPLLIVISRLADERLWVEVLNRSGFDVLPKPFVHSEVCRVLGYALRKRTNMVSKPPARSERESRLRWASAGLRAC